MWDISDKAYKVLMIIASIIGLVGGIGGISGLIAVDILYGTGAVVNCSIPELIAYSIFGYTCSIILLFISRYCYKEAKKEIDKDE